MKYSALNTIVGEMDYVDEFALLALATTTIISVGRNFSRASTTALILIMW